MYIVPFYMKTHAQRYICIHKIQTYQEYKYILTVTNQLVYMLR